MIVYYVEIRRLESKYRTVERTYIIQNLKGIVDSSGDSEVVVMVVVRQWWWWWLRTAVHLDGGSHALW
jgi:hypothetical protein